MSNSLSQSCKSTPNVPILMPNNNRSTSFGIFAKTRKLEKRKVIYKLINF